MIARTESLMSLCPTRIDLDAELREAKRATRRAEIKRNREALRVAAAPLPAVPAATAQALRREALRRLGLTPEARSRT
jgi:hypothetical protein